MERVTPERTFWRDAGISLRHRLWGIACRATDIDFVLVEYFFDGKHNRIEISALIEYKNEYAPPQRLRKQQYQVLGALGNQANIPAFAVRYSSDFSRFKVVPVNSQAKERLLSRTDMTELEYVTFLYGLRGLPLVPQEVIDAIGGKS